ncbi:MAG: MBL fold metallo-hydrolase [Solirubrobacteraceae bacterium]
MRLTIGGKSPSWQDAGGACSGYLIEQDGYSLLIDCGNGVFGALRGRFDYVELDAVLITHMHADHFLDLIPFSYALQYSPRQQPTPVGRWSGREHPARPELHAPPGAGATLRALLATFAEPGLIERSFELHEYDPAAELQLGPFRVCFAEVPHFVRAFAVDVTGGYGSRFTFSADCGPNQGLVSLASGTDLLLVEATLPGRQDQRPRGHLSAADAGEIARRADAARVVLTHFSDEFDEDTVIGEAAAEFSGPIDLARAGEVHLFEPAAGRAGSGSRRAP